MEADIEIGGKSYRLTAGSNTLVKLESAFSTPEKRVTVLQILNYVNQGSFTHIRGLVWAMLRKHHPDLTQDDVGDLIDAAGGVNAFEEKFTAVLHELQPDPKDLQALGVSANPPRAQATPLNGKKAGTGGRSTRKRNGSA